MKKENILVAGAGLCGSLLGLMLAQKGYKIDILERRPDMRKEDVAAGRSINLALSNRGLAGLKLVGLEQEVASLCIPMYGRMLHDLEGNTQLVKYSGRDDEYINSISRSALNELLLNEVDKYDAVQIDFDDAVKEVDLSSGTVHYYDNETNTDKTWKTDILFGTDGAGSKVRKSFEKQRDILFSHGVEWLPHGYKELSIPPGPNGEWLIDKNALHIWPRGGYMVIALPNLDGSFTVTLFLQYEGEGYSFNTLDTEEKVLSFFKEQFGNIVPLIPNLTQQYFENPTPPLGTIKCHPWTAHNKVLLMGDASHAIVPFYGQGMNASFEDVVVFEELLRQDKGWEWTFNEFSRKRKPDADAIAELAQDNFVEMRDSVSHPDFQKKRQIEMKLEKELPAQYNSKYSLVTFRNDVSYSYAMKRGRAQNKAILALLETGEITPDDASKELLTKINAKTDAFLKILN